MPGVGHVRDEPDTSLLEDVEDFLLSRVVAQASHCCSPFPAIVMRY